MWKFLKKHKTKILIILYFIALGALIFWIYPIIKLRYTLTKNFQTNQEINLENIKPAKELDKDDREVFNDEADNSATDTEDNEEDLSDDDDSANENVDDSKFIDITQEDCNQECSQFEDKEDIEYCREVCGLDDENTETKNKCDDLQDLEKDYCWKDKAIAEQNFDACQKIEDEKIKETCQNRITEDILENN